MLYVDTREPPSVIKAFRDIGIKCEQKTLPIGDIYDEDSGVVIERKTVEDFIGSVKTQHLQKQLLQMKDLPHPFLIIHGTFNHTYNIDLNFSMAQFTGAMASSLLRYNNIRVIRLLSLEELVLFVKSVISKVDDGKIVDIFDTELLRNKIDDSIMEKGLLMCFRGVGKKRANKLLNDKEINCKVKDFLGFLKGKGVYK